MAIERRRCWGVTSVNFGAGSARWLSGWRRFWWWECGGRSVKVSYQATDLSGGVQVIDPTMPACVAGKDIARISARAHRVEKGRQEVEEPVERS